MKRLAGWLILIFGFVIPAGLPLAAQTPPRPGDDLARRLSKGDVVSVTDREGTTTKGRITEVAPCSLVVEADDGPVEFQTREMKTVKRHKRADRPAPPERIADAGDRCDGPGCMAVSLVFKAGTGVKRGFQKLFKRSEVVYRADEARTPRCN